MVWEVLMVLKIDEENLKAMVRISERLPNPGDMELLHTLLLKIMADKKLTDEETAWISTYMPRFQEHMVGLLFPHSLDIWIVLIPTLIAAMNAALVYKSESRTAKQKTRIEK